MTFILESVALFTRAWIEIETWQKEKHCRNVALFTRAWIEIDDMTFLKKDYNVALFTRAWIEIFGSKIFYAFITSPSSRGRGLKL